MLKPIDLKIMYWMLAVGVVAFVVAIVLSAIEWKKTGDSKRLKEIGGVLIWIPISALIVLFGSIVDKSPRWVRISTSVLVHSAFFSLAFSYVSRYIANTSQALALNKMVSHLMNSIFIGIVLAFSFFTLGLFGGEALPMPFLWLSVFLGWLGSPFVYNWLSRRYARSQK